MTAVLHDPAAWRIRVATQPHHGGGHLERMRVLAGAMRKRGNVVFLLDSGSDAGVKRLQAAGFGAYVVTDAPDLPCQATIVDGYEFPASELEGYAAVGPLVVMNDVGAPCRAADLVINASFGLAGRHLDGLPALLGPRYALVDPVFAKAQRSIAPEVARILITFGLRDDTNATCLALAAIKAARKQGLDAKIQVVLGAAAPHRASIEAELAKMGEADALRIDVKDMAELLAKADLVVGAGGVSLFERALAGVPSVSMVIADNHRLFTEEAGADGVTLCLGEASEVSAAALAHAIIDLARDSDRRARMAKRGRRIVDGKGAERIAVHLAGMSPRSWARKQQVSRSTG